MPTTPPTTRSPPTSKNAPKSRGGPPAAPSSRSPTAGTSHATPSRPAAAGPTPTGAPRVVATHNGLVQHRAIQHGPQLGGLRAMDPTPRDVIRRHISRGGI